MGYSLGELPTSQATLDELADYMEYQCLISDDLQYSITSANSAMGISYDDYIDECVDCSDSDNFRYALGEVDERNYRSNRKYPFESGVDTIKIKNGISTYLLDVYTFLLLATRENMSARKVVGSIDGTVLFEHLCADVLKNYFGNNSKSYVFGTGALQRMSFQEKVEDFIRKLNENGYCFRSPDGDKCQQKDGKIDVISFIPFSDTRKGQFTAFAQCKTGTSWRSSIYQLKPQAFINSYMQPALAFTPNTIFFVCESFTDNW